MDEIRAGLVGISGYAGMELARLLARHPSMRLTMACSRTEAGKKLDSFYPFLRHLPGSEVKICEYEPKTAAKLCDVVFLAVPAGTAMRMVPELLEAGVKVVDLSADFRLRDVSVYEDWYGRTHECATYLSRAAYGLPELYGRQIGRSSLVANPGCYPSSVILGLYCALKNGIIEPDVIVDAKSGASGAGRKAAVQTLFCEVSDNFRAYSLPRHRHIPEMEQELAVVCNEPVRVCFTPHIVPMKRGILSTIYCRLKDKNMTLEAIWDLYQKTWSASPWIRVLPLGDLPQTADVRGSMFCDIGLVFDARSRRLIILSAIDNLCRGASGQALANANLMFGLPVETGMDNLAPLP